jgi:hypothetical protein
MKDCNHHAMYCISVGTSSGVCKLRDVAACSIFLHSLSDNCQYVAHCCLDVIIQFMKACHLIWLYNLATRNASQDNHT